SIRGGLSGRRGRLRRSSAPRASSSSVRRSSSDVRRWLLNSSAILGAVWLVAMPPRCPAPGVEDLFVAQTHAAADAESMCTMPDRGGQEPRIAIPQTSDGLGGDQPPVRMVV